MGIGTFFTASLILCSFFSISKIYVDVPNVDKYMVKQYYAFSLTLLIFAGGGQKTQFSVTTTSTTPPFILLALSISFRHLLREAAKKKFRSFFSGPATKTGVGGVRLGH